MQFVRCKDYFEMRISINDHKARRLRTLKATLVVAAKAKSVKKDVIDRV